MAKYVIWCSEFHLFNFKLKALKEINTKRGDSKNINDLKNNQNTVRDSHLASTTDI